MPPPALDPRRGTVPARHHAPLVAARRAVAVVGRCRRSTRPRTRRERRQLGPGARRGLSGPEHPALERRLLRVRHAELRGTQPDHQHPGVDVARRRALDPVDGDALPQLPGLGQEGNTWAPSVVYDGSGQRFRHVLHGDGGAPPATSASGSPPPRSTPAGPVHRHLARRRSARTASTPVTRRQRELRREHRPRHLHRPVTGHSWLLWKSDGNHIGEGTTSIWSVPSTLASCPGGRTHPEPPPRDDQPWQGGIVEGPDMYFSPAGGSGVPTTSSTPAAT